MYGSTRYLYTNFITDAAMIDPSVQRPGVVTGAMKTGLGSAELLTGGAYTGAETLVYLVQIHDVSGGKSVGQAKYRWRESSMQDGVWGGEDIVTHSDQQTLNKNVEIGFKEGEGNDFEGYEQYVFRALPSFGPGNLLQIGDRGSFFRTSDDETDLTLTINLGSPQDITVVSLGDHNLSASATILLKANSSDSWGSPPVSESLGVADPLVHYQSFSYQYVQFDISDASNPDGFLELSFLYVGTYLQPSKRAVWGSAHDLEFHENVIINRLGVEHGAVYSDQDIFDLRYPVLPPADVDLLRTMARTLKDRSTGRRSPLTLHLFSDEANKIYLAHLVGGVPRKYEGTNYQNVTLKFREVVKPRV